MKAKIISIFIGLICLPLLALGQEVPEIGRIEVLTQDFTVETIEEIAVYEVTETKTSWTVREINFYLELNQGRMEDLAKVIKQFNALRGKVLEAIKDVKLKTQGESL